MGDGALAGALHITGVAVIHGERGVVLGKLEGVLLGGGGRGQEAENRPQDNALHGMLRVSSDGIWQQSSYYGYRLFRPQHSARHLLRGESDTQVGEVSLRLMVWVVWAPGARSYLIRAVNPTDPVLLGPVWLRLPLNVQRRWVTCRSYPAGAPPAPLAGVYVHVLPPSLEYAVATVRPVEPRLLVTDPILKSELIGTESVTTRASARRPPELVNVTV